MSPVCHEKITYYFILLLFSCSQEDQSMKNCIRLQTKSIIKNGNEMKINKEIAIKYCNLFDESFQII